VRQDGPVDLVGALELQARACAELGSPMYGDLLGRAAADAAEGGPVAAALAGLESADPVGDMVALRLLGSVHRLVLLGEAEELAAYYPSAGGSWEPLGGWRAFRRLLAERPEQATAWLDRAPQTNEVGRAAALYGALLQLPRDLPVRLAEIGASAGLNLRADRFRYVDDTGRVFGDPSSPVRLDGAWGGRRLEPWPELEVVQRVGCDVRPVDVTTEEGALVLTAYVWPDQHQRLQRLRDAVSVAAQVPASVRAQDAAEFVAELQLVEGTTTVVWHSVMWQYLPAQTREAVTRRLAQLGHEATASRRLAHVAVEPVRRDPEMEFVVTAQVWPGDGAHTLGTTEPHGVPTAWG
jgi:hypothetical protein